MILMKNNKEFVIVFEKTLIEMRIFN